MPPALTLVADIGGTNTRVALADGAVVRQNSVTKFRNADFTGIDAVLARYMTQEGIARIDGACMAGAGPVQDGAVTMTNLHDENGAPWIIDFFSPLAIVPVQYGWNRVGGDATDDRTGTTVQAMVLAIDWTSGRYDVSQVRLTYRYSLLK